MGAAIQPVHIQDNTENKLIFKHMLKSPWLQSVSLTVSPAPDIVSVLVEYLMPFLKFLQE